METNFTYDRQVSGKEFIGRKAEKDLLKTAIYTGNNVSFTKLPRQESPPFSSKPFSKHPSKDGITPS